MSDQHLRVYLEDHLAANAGAIALARRCRRSNDEEPLSTVLDNTIAELEQAHSTMRRALRSVGGSESWIKTGVARAAELVGRFKPNNALLSYSDLSRIYELETLIVTLELQRMVWRTLAWAKIRDARLNEYDFEALAERAEQQREAVAIQREQAIEPAFETVTGG